ncbi:CvpA family protein [Texcoconibacillus texcoconensis]|uniref:Putative membrane protein required for colicin V production n=1 Tax=Texcoconibacillus texcoconensis TaxID=1095777 RepID=A0A840QMU1_9BACI|nr:CvpA family protein [Texcoconibacillus texcoconensis]MBB5172687.1 putative membrane protein required for colicin V production [Texcoconibacillus texcoconensis]
MLFSLLILFLLTMSFFVGFRRGLILQIIHLFGFIIAFIVAAVYFQDLSSYIRLWIPFPQLDENGTMNILIEGFQLEDVYYNGISFVILFFGVKIVLQIFGSMLDFLAHLPLISIINRWLGGVLGFLEGLLMVVIGLHLLALLQFDWSQSALENSMLAQLILEYTPVISQQLKEWWIDQQ